MKFIAITTGLCLLPFSGFSQSMCEQNTSAQATLLPQYDTMLCAFDASALDQAQTAVTDLGAQLSTNHDARMATRALMNDAADRTIKTDAKISSLIEESNVSTDDSILILGVAPYDSIKILQAEREGLVTETLELQGQMDALDADRDTLNQDLARAQGDLAAASAANSVFDQSLTALRDALTQTNYVATALCGAPHVTIAATCVEN